uniref:Uncharacterized protein n=1 Tax=Cacopsylla melanoneura TaxID=428564 RepID=A0A8D8V032_9HEMI
MRNVASSITRHRVLALLAMSVIRSAYAICLLLSNQKDRKTRANLHRAVHTVCAVNPTVTLYVPVRPDTSGHRPPANQSAWSARNVPRTKRASIRSVSTLVSVCAASTLAVRLSITIRCALARRDSLEIRSLDVSRYNCPQRKPRPLTLVILHHVVPTLSVAS